MVAVSVGDDDGLDFAWIEPERLQSTLDDPLGLFLTVHGVNQDDAVGCRERPGAYPFASDEIQVVERLAGRWSGHCHQVGKRNRRSFVVQIGRVAEREIGLQISAGGFFCCCEVSLYIG